MEEDYDSVFCWKICGYFARCMISKRTDDLQKFGNCCSRQGLSSGRVAKRRETQSPDVETPENKTPSAFGSCAGNASRG